MRLIAALVGLFLLTAAAPTRDWNKVVRQTPAGAYVLGNPAAKVKLVEYGSYTCPHCGHFSVESEATLKGQMIRSGAVSLEFRNLIRDPLDLAAALLARCQGAQGFFPTTATLFAAQGDWLERGYAYQQANQARLQMYPVLAQLRAYADGAGLTGFMKARGMTDAAVNACFANQAEVDRITAITAAVPKEVQGTPAFFVNGRFVPAVAWSSLEPALRAAGAR